MTLQLRQAQLTDALAIARLHIASWRVAYRAELPADFLDALDESRRAEQWTTRLQHPTTEVLVAQRTGSVSIVGFCAHGPAGGASSHLTGAWEIYALHVAPETRGTGIGSALFDAARERAVKMAASPLVLWVVASNAPARRFYESKGMRPDGGEKRRPLAPEVELHEVRYSVSLQ